MNTVRISEIENELLAVIPNEVYHPDLEPVICDICSGATDDHRVNCYVPLVCELLAEIKRAVR